VSTVPRTSSTEIKVIGKSFAGKTLRVERRDDGSIVLTAVAMVPESQLWTLEEPDRSRIARGMAWAVETKPGETDLGALLRRRSRGAGRTRGRRQSATPRGCRRRGPNDRR
jgi:hypothetical protein